MKATTKRGLKWLGCVLVAAWLALVGYVDWAMHQPPETFARVMEHLPMPAWFVLPFGPMWNEARGGHIKPGDPAPDFTVETLDTKAPVQLGSLWSSKPVVLVFGSYT